MNTTLAAYKDVTIVVAGGASGIGEQLVRQTVQSAKKIIILDRNSHAGYALVSELGESVQFIELEMKDAAAVERVVQDIFDAAESIDYFINCAGSFMAGEIRDTTTEQWREIYDENILPVAHATRFVYDHMRKAQHGHIVTLASSAGLFPVPVMSIYGSTKSAVVTAMLGLRMEARNFNVRVSVVCPTVVDTPLYDRAIYAGLQKNKALKFLRERSSVQTPARAAQQILKKVPKNRAIIHTAASTYFGWALYRISPTLYMYAARRVFPSYRKNLRTNQDNNG